MNRNQRNACTLDSGHGVNRYKGHLGNFKNKFSKMTKMLVQEINSKDIEGSPRGLYEVYSNRRLTG